MTRTGHPARFVLTFLLTAAAGTAAFVVLALFIASGQAHMFAEAAVLAGILLAALVLVLRMLGRLLLAFFAALVRLLILFARLPGLLRERRGLTRAGTRVWRIRRG